MFSLVHVFHFDLPNDKVFSEQNKVFMAPSKGGSPRMALKGWPPSISVTVVTY